MKKFKQNGPKPLAVLTEEERIEYARRRNAMDAKHLELLAVCAYVDQYTAFLTSQYELPRYYNIDLQTGVVTNAEDASLRTV